MEQETTKTKTVKRKPLWHFTREQLRNAARIDANAKRCAATLPAAECYHTGYAVGWFEAMERRDKETTT